MEDTLYRRFRSSRIREIIREAGYLQDHKKPDVLGLFDEIQTIGQDFLHLMKTIREESEGDKFIVGEIEKLVVDCLRSGDIEKFVDGISNLKTTIEDAY